MYVVEEEALVSVVVVVVVVVVALKTVERYVWLAFHTRIWRIWVVLTSDWRPLLLHWVSVVVE